MTLSFDSLTKWKINVLIVNAWRIIRNKFWIWIEIYSCVRTKQHDSLCLTSNFRVSSRNWHWSISMQIRLAHGRVRTQTNRNSHLILAHEMHLLMIIDTILTGSIFDDWFFFSALPMNLKQCAEYARHFKFLVFIFPNEIVLFSVIQQMAGDPKHWFFAEMVSVTARLFRLRKHWNSITFALSLFVWISSFSLLCKYCHTMCGISKDFFINWTSYGF